MTKLKACYKCVNCGIIIQHIPFKCNCEIGDITFIPYSDH